MLARWGCLNREFLKKLKLDKNELVIVDMEAGVEHFGRGIEDSIDTVLACSGAFDGIYCCG